MISAFKGHLEVVDFLLENGANPDEQAHCGATAMHYAAESGHTEICQSLLDHNAVMMKNEYGMSPVITAAERTKEAVVAMYCERENLLTTEEVGSIFCLN